MQKIQITYESIKHEERFDYVLDFLNHHPLNPELVFLSQPDSDAFMTIGYGQKKGDFFVEAQNDFFSNNDIQTDKWFANQYEEKGKVFYSVEQQKRSIQPFFKNKKIQFDIFETIFFHISRYEEVFCKASDKSTAGWLKEEKHFLVKHQLESKPIIDQLVKAFFERILEKPIQQKTTYDISHDVDILTRFQPLSKFIKSLGATIVYRRGMDQLTKSWKHFFKMRKGEVADPYDSFDYLFRKEAIWQKQVVYFMAGGSTKYDNKYSLQDKEVDKILKIAISKGYSVGIHPSFDAGFQKEMYASEKKALEDKINKPIQLNRQHWLRWDWDITPYLFDELGIIEDATMGYNRFLGFRCGTGFPYFLYDFKNEKKFSWKERPMAFMESSAIHQSLKTDLPLDQIMKEFLKANKYDSHISFNFHNSNFDPTLKTGETLIHFYKNELINILEAN